MKSRRFSGSQTTVDDENPYWISFSDIMSGLLVIFVLASLALILELTVTKFEVNDAIRELARAEQIRRDILREIEEDLRKRNIHVEISDNHTVLRIPENILSFDNNEYRIPDAAGMRETALEIGHVLADCLPALEDCAARHQYVRSGRRNRRRVARINAAVHLHPG